MRESSTRDPMVFRAQEVVRVPGPLFVTPLGNGRAAPSAAKRDPVHEKGVQYTTAHLRHYYTQHTRALFPSFCQWHTSHTVWHKSTRALYSHRTKNVFGSTRVCFAWFPWPASLSARPLRPVSRTTHAALLSQVHGGRCVLRAGASCSQRACPLVPSLVAPSPLRRFGACEAVRLFSDVVPTVTLVTYARVRSLVVRGHMSLRVFLAPGLLLSLIVHLAVPSSLLSISGCSNPEVLANVLVSCGAGALLSESLGTRRGFYVFSISSCTLSLRWYRFATFSPAADADKGLQYAFPQYRLDWVRTTLGI